MTVDDSIFYAFSLGTIGTISVINIFGNTLVIQSILRHQNLNIPGNYFIIAVACSDLLFGLVYPVYNISHMEVESVNSFLGE